MKAILEQIARRANVSRRTVSRVLNKKGHVKPELERKVLKALKDYLLTDSVRELHRPASDLMIYSAVNFDDEAMPSHEKGVDY